MNFQEPYLRAVLGMPGIQSVRTIILEYTAMNGDNFNTMFDEADARIDRLFD